MVDTKTEALTVAPKSNKLTVRKKMKEKEFVPSIRVRRSDGSIICVPRDAEANKNQSIILAETAREFVAKQIKKWDEAGRALTPQELKELVTAAKLVNDMGIVAHEDIFVPTEKSGKPGSSSTGILLKAVEAAAKGVTSGNAEASQKAIDRFMSLGKKEKKAGSIDVEVTPVQ